MEPFRQLEWNVVGPGWLYVLLIPALAAMVYGFYTRLWPFFAGGRDKTEAIAVRDRLRNLWAEAISQRRIRRQRLPGVMHLGLFWGILGLFAATVLVSFQAYLGFPALRGRFYLWVLSLGADLAGIAAVAGVCLAVYRRYIRPEKRLAGVENRGAFAVLLGLLLTVLISGFLVEGLRISATRDPWGGWSPGGRVFAALFSQPQESLIMGHRVLWWAHSILALGLIAYLPFSPLAHSVLAFFSLWNRRASPAGTLPAPSGNGMPGFPVTGHPRHLTGKEVLDCAACVECGRCHEVCPAASVERPLSPRRFLLDVRRSVRERSRREVNPDVIWSCTTCGACTEECPVLVEHVGLMVDYRRFLVERGNLPASMLQALESLARWGNPWNSPPAQRGSWMESMRVPPVTEKSRDIELLYFMGCSAAHDPVARTAAKSLLEILNRSGMAYAVLGTREGCCGDMARRLGEEGLFRKLAAQNAAEIARLNPQRIVTTCPHCYHAFTREYSGLPPGVNTIHYTSLIEELLSSGRLRVIRDLGLPVTYHDPCYLSRYGGEFQAPRRVLQACRGVEIREMQRNGAGSFCCGGGGGQAWLDVRGTDRMDRVRVNEAVKTGAEKIITACPYCQIMLNSSAAAAAGSPKIMVQDIAEFVLERV